MYIIKFLLPSTVTDESYKVDNVFLLCVRITNKINFEDINAF